MSSHMHSVAKPVEPSSSFAPLRSGLLQRQCNCGSTAGIGGDCEGCRKNRLQRSATNAAGPSEAPAIVHDVLRSPGRPLDTATRKFFEPRFGHDFGHVRVHTDRIAAESADAVNALAYTVGHELVFGAGRYAPETRAGQYTLAHELAHVVQAGNQGNKGHDGITVGPADDPAEKQADLRARQALSGTAVNQSPQIAPTRLQRLPRGGDPIHERETDEFRRGEGLPESGRDDQGNPAGPSEGHIKYGGLALPSVDRIDFVDTGAGAIGGYPGVTSGNLNSPGPFNNPATNGVSHALQVQFHLDVGDSRYVRARREIQRTATFGGAATDKNPPDRPAAGGVPAESGGFDGTLVGPDGPASHEVQRPNQSLIVIADAPGLTSIAVASFPFIYHAHFTVTLATDSGRDIALISYDVLIIKRTATEVPNTQNRADVVEKRDLFLGRAL